MRIFIFSLVIFSLTACQEATDTTTTSTNTTITENTNTVDPATEGDFPTKLKSGLPIYHAFIGITDTIGGERVQYMCDMVVYHLNKKFAFVNKQNELFVTDTPDTINATNLHQHVPYVMKMHAFQGAITDNGQNVQIINVGFNYNEATQTSRAKAADRPEWYNWTDRANLKATSLPACKDMNEVKCKAQQLVRNVAKLAFT